VRFCVYKQKKSGSAWIFRSKYEFSISELEAHHSENNLEFYQIIKTIRFIFSLWNNYPWCLSFPNGLKFSNYTTQQLYAFSSTSSRNNK